MRLLLMGCLTVLYGCGFSRPKDVAPDDGPPSMPGPVCEAGSALRCEADRLVRCNDDGSAEIQDSCVLGCNAGAQRCNDVNPSNGLAELLDLASNETDIDLGSSATINTDNGTVMVDGIDLYVRSTLTSQTGGPVIRVLIVRSLVAGDIQVQGSNAVAIASANDLTINGIFNASAFIGSGPGAFSDATCQGKDGTKALSMFSGVGGGGFGDNGGHGGSTTNTDGTVPGGAGGMPTGNAELTPLRGGCNSGSYGSTPGFAVAGGGGAIQLLSRSKIVIMGTVAVNGASAAAGGSGGGVLLEAPRVDIPGNVVANGGAGSGGCFIPTPAEAGRLDAMPAAASQPCNVDRGSRGGNGGARAVPAGAGADFDGVAHDETIVYGGHGGGGVGRIRVNTVAGGLTVTGIASPTPSTGILATR